MGRTPNVPNRFPAVSGNAVSPRSDMVKSEFSGSWWDLLLVRAVVVVLAVVACYYFRPFGLARIAAAAAGFVFAVLVILAEMRLRSASLRRLLGAAVGALLGTFGAFLMNLVLLRTSIPESTRSFLGVALLLLLGYMGALFDTEHTSRAVVKLLDTSVIIDGRVADICETHFLDGVLLVPQFVLRELQLVADSADPLKRQRGRRGLEVLQRIQKMPHLDVEIAEDDFPQIAEVDMKLIELAKRYDAKIVTNDFNLNKVATLQGIQVLNVNQLANALKPVVLPGETMRVFILREGKEY